MPQAESASVGKSVWIETCGHFMCACKTTLDDNPMKALVDVNGSVTEDRMLTSLDILDSEGRQKTVQVNGIYRPDQVVDAFNQADGKMLITDAGLVCCALDKLGR